VDVVDKAGMVRNIREMEYPQLRGEMQNTEAVVEVVVETKTMSQLEEVPKAGVHSLVLEVEVEVAQTSPGVNTVAHGVPILLEVVAQP
jgi:hypothetical protein